MFYTDCAYNFCAKGKRLKKRSYINTKKYKKRLEIKEVYVYTLKHIVRDASQANNKPVVKWYMSGKKSFCKKRANRFIRRNREYSDNYTAYKRAFDIGQYF